MPARKTVKRTTKKTTKKVAKRTTGKKAAFGGYKICFKGRQDNLEKIFGSRPIAPSMMTKKLWHYVKAKKLYNF